MQLAVHLVISVMRRIPFALAALLVLSLLIFPTAEAAPPKALKVGLSGSLGPAETTSFPWNLNRNISEFLFHYEVTGGTEPLDVIHVYIEESGDSWQFLMGKGWAYCECPLDAGAYTVTVESDLEATGPLGFNVGFYSVSQAPVDFDGFMPANSDLRLNDFGVLFPSSTTYALVLGATAGSYELFVDGESQAVVTGTATLDLNLEAGFHLFELSSSAVAPDQDVRWTVQVQGQPKLEVSIVNPCPVLNPESGESACVTGATADASDGGTPTVTYQWTASGGEFNSTSSQWVEWTAQPGVASFTLTVEASAQGYVSDTDSLTVQVVPEFSPSFLPLVLMLALAFAALARRKSA